MLNPFHSNRISHTNNPNRPLAIPSTTTKIFASNNYVIHTNQYHTPSPLGTFRSTILLNPLSTPFGNSDKSNFVVTRNHKYIRFLNSGKRHGRRPSRQGDIHSGSTSTAVSWSGPSTPHSNNCTRTVPPSTKIDYTECKSGN